MAALSDRTPTITKLATGHTITDDDSYDAALTLIQTIIDAENKVIAFFKTSKDLAFKTHRAICAQENEVLQPYKDAEKILSTKRVGYATKKEAERREQQRIADDALKAERDAQAVNQAAELANIGEHAAAEQVIERATTQPAPAAYVAPAVPKSEGTSKRGKWEIEITDPDAVERIHCSPDMGIIKKLVDALGEKHNVKGIRATWVPTEGYSRKSK